MLQWLRKSLCFGESHIKNKVDHLGSFMNWVFSWGQMTIQKRKGGVINLEPHRTRPFIFRQSSKPRLHFTHVQLFNSIEYFSFSKKAYIAAWHLFPLIKSKLILFLKGAPLLIHWIQSLKNLFIPHFNQIAIFWCEKVAHQCSYCRFNHLLKTNNYNFWHFIPLSNISKQR